jgi:EAL and modified HD-GYP domain-containing signal transduction protein
MGADEKVADVVVGRQGIFTADRHIIGYELLFRGFAGHAAVRATGASGDQMTAEVIYGANAIGLDHLVSGRMIFCNADRGVLDGTVPIALPPTQTVVEVVETVAVDPDMLAGCHRLIDAGYRLAADDFLWRPGAEMLLPLTSIVKIDLLQVHGPELTELVQRCKDFDVLLLAEKVEDATQLDELIGMGFELFQGYALERPEMVAGSAVEPSDLSRLRTAANFLGPELDFDQIEEIIKHDPGLAMQVMRLASMGRVGEMGRKVSSLHEALVLAGSRRVQNWVALLLARPTSGGAARDRFTSTLIRARACELLATRVDPSLASLGFAAGMLSAVDILLHVSPDEARTALPLSDELNAAAFGADTPVGRLVRDAIDFQMGRPNPHRLSGVTTDELENAFASAFAWAMASSSVLAQAT